MELAIIGGGASGMAAAIAAAENPQCHVFLLERQSRVGRKLLSTGNGRCNLGNAGVSPAHYHGETPEFVIPALGRFDFENTLNFFGSLGLLTVQEENGKVYPWSDQASSVLDVLRFALEKPNITLLTDWEVRKVQKTGDGFMLQNTKKESLSCDRLIVACGGLAGTALGGSLSGYQLLKSLGHKAGKLRPALVPVKSSYPRCASLKGIRANCTLDLLKNGQVVKSNSGEMQFTQYGISGPVVFEISRFACDGSGDWAARLDLLPGISADALLKLLWKRQSLDLPAEDLLVGTIHNRLGRVVIQEAGISLNTPMRSLSAQDLRRVVEILKAFTLDLQEPLGMDSAQVTAGGILTRDFDPETMESKLCPGLYACGEVLDIDGDCGGFNLQWAWSSGRLAGTSAGKETL